METTLHEPRNGHCFLACSGTNFTKISDGTPFSSGTRTNNIQKVSQKIINENKKRPESRTRQPIFQNQHTMGFEIKQWWKESAIWQASIWITKLVEERMRQGIKLHHIKQNHKLHILSKVEKQIQNTKTSKHKIDKHKLAKPSSDRGKHYY